MLRGFYVASNGVLNQQKVIDTISNNIANSQTPGYKYDTTVQNTFKTQLLKLQGKQPNKTGTIEYKYFEESKTCLDQGSLEYTQKPLDIALSGPAYFNINAGNEERLTRNGQFSIDADGYLSLSGVGRVVGTQGEIYVGKSDFVIDNSGNVFIDRQRVNTLKLTFVNDNSNLHKNGDNTFTQIDTQEDIPNADYDFAVIQGAYERSNVDVAVEMSRAMTSQRSFESMSQALKMLDKVNDSIANSLGKL